MKRFSRRFLNPIILLALVAACGKLADVTGPRSSLQKLRTIRRNASALIDPSFQPAGLKACFAGEGNTVDSVGTRVATLTGNVTYGPGKFGSAFQFNAVSGDISLPTDSAMNVGSGAGMTFAAWVLPQGMSWGGVPGSGPVMEFESGSHMWVYNTQEDPSVSATSIYANFPDSSTGAWNQTQARGFVTPGEWNLLSVTYDKAAGVMIAYVNGIEVSRTATNAFTPITWTTFRIGSRPAGSYVEPKVAFNGLIDEVQLYNRALGADEEAALFLSPDSKCHPPATALAVSQPPVGVESGKLFATQPVVALRNAYNQLAPLVDMPVTASVTAGIGSLSGTTTVMSVGGIATFTDLQIAGRGPVTLTFTSPGLTSTATIPTVVQVARQLSISTMPGGAVSGFLLATQPVVELRDAAGLLVVGATNPVTATITSGGGTLLGVTTVNAINGVATFNTLQVNGAGTPTITFSTPGVLPAGQASATVAVAPGPDAQLAITAQPNSAESGVAFSTQPVVEVRDGTGSRTHSTTAITVDIAAGPGVISGQTTVNAIDGAATFTNLTIAGASPATQLRFQSLGLGSAISNSFSVVQVVRQIPLITQPSASAVSGFALTQQPRVELRDAAGLLMTSATNAITVSINSGPGTISGTTTVSAVAGIATFTNLIIVGAGSSTLAFNTPGALTTLSLSIAVTAAPPTQLGITTQPSAVEAGGLFSPAISVDVRDAFGGRVAGAAVPVTVAIASGSGVLIGTTTVTSSNGTAVFSDLKVSGAGSFTLTFTSAGLTAATSVPFGVTQIVRQLVLSSTPAGAVSGFVFVTQPVIELRDAAGVAITSSTAPVTVAVSSGLGVLSGTATMNAVGGVATFSGLSLTGVGNTTLSFSSPGATTTLATVNVTAAPATQLSVLTQPTAVESGTLFASPITVQVKDALGGQVAGASNTVTATITTGTGTLIGSATVAAVNGLATFTNLQVGGAGTFVLTFSSSGLTNAVSNSFSVTQIVRSMVLANPPAGAASGLVLTQQPVVQFKDAAGLLVPGATNSVAAAVTAGLGVLTGTTTISAAGGVATFSNLIITGAGSSTLTFASTGLTSVSSVVSVTSIPAVALAMQTQPAGTESGVVLTTQPVVAIKDLAGNTVAGATSAVTAQIQSGSGTLAGTTTVTAVDGVATFTNLKITGTGAHTLRFTASALTAVTSSAVTMSQIARGLAFVQSASGAISGFNFNTQPVVQVIDAGGLAILTATNAVTVAVSAGPGVLGGGPYTVNASGGNATFANLKLTGTGITTLTYSSPGVTSVSAGIIVQSAPAAALAVATQPSGAESGVAFTAQPVVQVRDGLGNVVTGSTVAVTASITSGSGTLSGTTTVSAVGGVATFTNLKIAGGGSHAINFTATALSSAASNSFVVSQVARSVSINTQPAGSVSGFALTTQPVVQLLDAAGLVVTSASGAVTVSTASGTATVSGSTTVNAVNGVATFTNVILSGGGNVTLAFAYSGATTATSSTLTVNSAPPTQLAITQGPTPVESGVTFSPTVTVEVRDGLGGRVSGATNAVTVSIVSGTGTLQGTTTVAAVNGTATFSDLQVAGYGTHSLLFTAAGLAQAASGSFLVTQVVRQSAVVTQPGGAESGVVMGSQPVVELRDQAGLRVVNATGAVTAGVGSGNGTLSGPVTVNAVAGIATFGGLKVAGSGNHVLSFAVASIPNSLSASFTVQQVARTLAIGTAPAGAVSGFAMTTQPSINVLDAAGLVVVGASTQVTASVSSGTGVLSGTQTVNAVNGVVTYTNLKLTGVGSTTLNFGASSLPSTSGTVSVAPAPASKLVITTQPGGAESGVNLAVQPVVAVRDAFGVTIANGTNLVTVAVASGASTLQGTTTVAAVNGVATFTDLKLVGGSAVTLSFTSTGLSPATSNLLSVSQIVRQVVVVQQPALAYDALEFGTQPVIELRDAAGVLASFANGVVYASIVSGNGTLFGTKEQYAVNGVVRFAGLGIQGLGTYTMNFKAGTQLQTGVPNSNSLPFSVTPAPPAALQIVTEPNGAESGVALTTQPVVEVRNILGARVAGSTNLVTASIGSGAGTLSGTTTVAAVNGTATFSNLKVSGASVGTTLNFTSTGLTNDESNAFPVTQVVRQIAVVTQPGSAPSGSLLNPQPTVELRDAAGLAVLNATNVVAVALSGSGTLAGTLTDNADQGQAVFSDLAVSGFGSKTLIFTVPALPAVLPVSSAPFNITAGAPASLAVTAQPTSIESGALMGTPIQVSVRDAAGNLVTAGSSPVTVSFFSGNGTLIGTQTVASVNGIATFTDLRVGSASGTVQLAFTSGALNGANTASITVNQVLRQLVVITQPSGGASGAAFGSQPAIELRDAADLRIATATNNVVATIASGSGTLGGTTTSAAVAGVVTFTNLTISGSGSYTLAFTSGSVSTNSAAFTITSVVPAALAITTQPTAVESGSLFSPVVTVEVRDASGSRVSGNSTPVTVAFYSGTGTLTGLTTVTAVNGIATFSDLRVGSASGSVRLAFSAGGLTGATSNAFAVTQVVRQLSILTQPSGGTSGAAFGTQPSLELRDGAGIKVVAATGTVTATIASGTGGAIIGGATATASAGVATYTGLGMTGNGGYTLSFGMTGATSVVSSNFLIASAGATNLGITTQPTSIESGALMSPTIQVQVRDASGAVVATSSAPITVSFATGTGQLIGTTTLNAVNGVATFTNLKVGSASGTVRLSFNSGTLAGATTGNITVTQVVRGVVITTQPGGAKTGVAFTQQPVLELRDAAGIRVVTATTSVTAARGSGTGVLSGTLTINAVGGIAQFTNLTITGVGPATLTFTVPGTSGATSASFNVGYALTFNGFFEPVYNNQVNVVEAGSLVPFKFTVAGVPNGTAVLLSVTSVGETCAAPVRNGPDSGGSNGNHEQYNWKTEKSWAGTCRVFTMTLIDGSTRSAQFRFK